MNCVISILNEGNLGFILLVCCLGLAVNGLILGTAMASLILVCRGCLGAMGIISLKHYWMF